MNFLKERLCVRGKIIFGAIGAAFLLFLGSTQPVHALFGIGNISTTVISFAAMVIAYVLAWIFGAFIAIEAWLIGVVLNINAGIMQTSFVQTGFSISLSVANLAFVLGIIVIALATILKIENYSIKKMLWKLVAMAILVNFGLVIISPIFAVSNTFTQYFLTSLPGGGSGSQSLNAFGQTMASKFNPGAMFAPVANPTQGTASTLAPLGLTGTADVPVGATLVPIFSLIFTIIDFVLIVFVLGVFIVMLMIRYVYVAILAILLPFAWASWVFPSFSHLNKQWWSKFLQWTFFAPIFMFFLYLALATIGGSNNADALNTTNYIGAGNSTFTAIMNFFGSAFGPIITNFLQEMVLAGLIIGGMIAADSMGVKFAGTVMNGAKSLGNKAVAATKKRAGVEWDKNRARHYSTPAERAKTTAMYDSNNPITRALADRRAAYADKGGVNLYKEDFKGMGKERAMGQLTSTQDEARRQGLLEYISEKGWEGDSRVQPYLSKEYEEKARRYGNEETFEKLRTKTGVGLNEAIYEGDQDRISAEIKKAVASNPEMLAGAFLSPEDIQKAIKKAADGGMRTPLFAQAGVAGEMQQAVIQSLPKLSSANVASLMNEVSKKNNTDGFTKAFEGLGASQKSAAKDALEGNPDLMRWIEKSPHKTVVDLAKLYGVKSQGSQAKGGIISDNLEANFKKIQAEQRAKNK